MAHSKIFNLFETLGSTDRFGEKSNGIGLATVKSLTEGLGGRIIVDSSLGKGTTFQIQIPS